MPMPSDTAAETWIRLARAYGVAISGIEQALSKNDFPPLIWYDILLELDRAGEAGLRQYELEDALLLKQYSVSRLVERIEKKGYLKRVACTSDGRGKRLIITKDGETLRRRMWQVYGPEIHRLFDQKLTREQSDEMSRLLGRLIDGAE